MINTSKDEQVDERKGYRIDCQKDSSIDSSRCRWHDEIQHCIKKIEEQIKNQEVHELCEEASKASKEWNLKFQLGSKKGKSMWQKIKNFQCKPSIFRMKELKIYLENDILAKNPSISKDDLNVLINKLITGIENEIGDELRQKFPDITEKNIFERLRNSGDKDKF